VLTSTDADPLGADRPSPDGSLEAEAWLTPVDRYLAAQHRLSAVERFADAHDADRLPAGAARYRDLIPVGPPGAGQQYAFDVDLDQCTGCKACVAACHSLNGLDDGESFRSAGLLVDPTAAGGWQQTVTTACHHCVDPACLIGCPVDAYEKDPITGIVVHLDDQCIGCSYCTLTCPYEVPRFNPSLGIVRKCDLCQGRLASGEAPACVQACPTSAISVGIVDIADVVARSDESAPAGALVPSAPASHLTVPTTRYRSRRGVPATAVAADQFALRPAHAHRPLAVMLVLTQLSVGAFWAQLGVRLAAPGSVTATGSRSAIGALVVGLLALGASVLHLGRPTVAWRAVIGVRHSWLSREIVAFSTFATLAAVDALVQWRAPGSWPAAALAIGVAVSGAVGVLCSVALYAVTGRRWWRGRWVLPRFGLSAAITGPAFALALVVLDGNPSMLADDRGVRALVLTIVLASAVKLVVDHAVLVHVLDRTFTDLRRTALLLTGDLRPYTVVRVGTGLIGGVGGPLLAVALAAADVARPVIIVAVLGVVVLVLIGELAERATFFSAVSAPRMPGAAR
jgi:Fe-S-cluster-containing dehydrogenase component/DMSO reductase anchor subunit